MKASTGGAEGGKDRSLVLEFMMFYCPFGYIAVIRCCWRTNYCCDQ